MSDRGVRKNLIDLAFDDTTGDVEAVVATLGVVDKHGDVLEPGFAGEQNVRMIWGHDWQTPIGKGRVYEDGDQLKFTGRMFVDIPSVREKYNLVKAMDELQEWSWGFYILEGAASKDGQTRRIKSLPDGRPGVEIFEVSPVLVGAGVDTRTLAMKTSDPDNHGLGDYTITTSTLISPEPKRLRDEISDAARVLRSATDRTAEVMALRADKNRTLGDETLAALEELRASVEHAHQLIDAAANPAADEPDMALDERRRALLAQQLRQQFAAQGIA